MKKSNLQRNDEEGRNCTKLRYQRNGGQWGYQRNRKEWRKYLNETSALGADDTTGTGTGLTSSMRISKIIWHNFQNYSSTHTITVINIKNKTQSTTWNNLLLRGSDQNLFNIAWLSNNHWGRLLQVQCLIFNIFSNRFLSCCPEMTHLDDDLRSVLLQILRCRRCLETSL